MKRSLQKFGSCDSTHSTHVAEKWGPKRLDVHSSNAIPYQEFENILLKIVGLVRVQTFLEVRSRDWTWWPELSWPGVQIVPQVAENIGDKVGETRRCYASPFSRYLKKKWRRRLNALPPAWRCNGNGYQTDRELTEGKITTGIVGSGVYFHGLAKMDEYPNLDGMVTSELSTPVVKYLFLKIHSNVVQFTFNNGPRTTNRQMKCAFWHPTIFYFMKICLWGYLVPRRRRWQRLTPMAIGFGDTSGILNRLSCRLF